MFDHWKNMGEKLGPARRKKELIMIISEVICIHEYGIDAIEL